MGKRCFGPRMDVHPPPPQHEEGNHTHKSKCDYAADSRANYRTGAIVAYWFSHFARDGAR